MATLTWNAFISRQLHTSVRQNDMEHNTWSASRLGTQLLTNVLDDLAHYF